MRGDVLKIALGAAIAAAMFVNPSTAASLQGLAQEKAAAVSMLRSKAEHYAAALAHGRLFSAYLNASTVSEGNRVKARLATSLEALRGQFGLTSFHIVDRGGDLFLHIGDEKFVSAVPKSRKKKTDAVDADNAAVVINVSDHSLTYAAPVLRQDEEEFTLTVAQDLAVYAKVLALGTHRQRALAIVDERGHILADSRGSSALSLSDAQLHLIAKHAAKSEAGDTVDIEAHGASFKVNRQPAGAWLVIAIESAPTSPACPNSGAHPCH